MKAPHCYKQREAEDAALKRSADMHQCSLFEDPVFEDSAPSKPKHNGYASRKLIIKLRENGLKRCPKCKGIKPATLKFFHSNKSAVCGFCSYCIECEDKKLDTRRADPESVAIDKVRSAENYQRYKDNTVRYAKLRRSQKEANHKKRSTLIGTFSLSASSARCRARKIGVDASCLTGEFLLDLWNKQEGKCAITGYAMTYGVESRRGSDYGVTLDQIIPRGGYTVGNVQLVCWFANLMKTNMTMERLLEVCKRVVEKFDGKL